MVTRTEAEKEALELAGFKKKDIILMTKFSPVPYAEEILSKINIVYDSHSVLWRYDDQEGIWIPYADQFLRTLVRKNLLGDELQKKNYVEEIVAHIKDITHDDSFEIDNG